MSLYRVTCHQVGNGESFLIDTVECDKQSCKCQILIHESLRFVILAKSVELNIKGSDRFITTIRNRMQNDAYGRREIEVTTHHHTAVWSLNRQRRASEGGLLGLYLRFVMTSREIFYNVTHHLVCTLETTSGHQLVKAVVTFIFHIVESVVHLLCREGSLYQWTKLQPH